MPKKLNDTQVLEIVTKHANGTSILDQITNGMHFLAEMSRAESLVSKLPDDFRRTCEPHFRSNEKRGSRASF